MSAITNATKLTGASPITEQQVVDAIMATNPKRPEFTKSVVTRVFRKCAAIDLRGDVWVADAALETGNFASPIYVQYGNIGGLGVFDDGTNVGGTFADPEIAASAFVAHAMAYVYGRAITAGEGWIRYDPRWNAAIVRVNELGTISSVGQLGNGNWATNPDHADSLVARYSSLFKRIPISTPQEETPPVSITFGKVPHPAYQNRPITKAEGVGQNNLGKRTVKGVSWHRVRRGADRLWRWRAGAGWRPERRRDPALE
jgi:hypothetical protein